MATEHEKDDAEKKKLVTPATTTTTTRMTRSSGRMTRSSGRMTRSSGSSSLVAPLNPEPKKKKQKTVAAEEKSDKEIAPSIIKIEYWNQSKLFKKKAEQVKRALKKNVPGIKVLMNPTQPRRGWFEIQDEDGFTFLSYQNLERPYDVLKELNMEELIAEIIQWAK